MRKLVVVRIEVLFPTSLYACYCKYRTTFVTNVSMCMCISKIVLVSMNTVSCSYFLQCIHFNILSKIMISIVVHRVSSHRGPVGLPTRLTTMV